MKERVIHYIKTALRLALRIVSVMIAISFFILFFGILAAMGARGRARHGDFDKVRNVFLRLVLAAESVIMLVISVGMMIPLYVYAVIEGSVNAIAKKSRLQILSPMQKINSQRKDENNENKQNKEESQEEAQSDDGFFRKAWKRMGILNTRMIIVPFEKIMMETDEEWDKLNHADLKKEPEEKDTSELSAETEETAPAPRTRRKQKKRRSKKWRKKK